MTNVGRMALRRRLNRRLLNSYLSSTAANGTLVVTAATQPVRAVVGAWYTSLMSGRLMHLSPRVLVQRLFDATPLRGRSLGLGIIDRRLGQLGDPINGCD